MLLNYLLFIWQRVSQKSKLDYWSIGMQNRYGEINFAENKLTLFVNVGAYGTFGSVRT